MTRKDYVVIAKALAYAAEHGRNDVANVIADFLALDNPRFNRAVFLAAAGAS